ncbi:hypothetical protein GGR54DRAFT_640000 [Hypoxylon sp. NC1633]|nr:hypothetical protein GGR54DRAFT_640000 [Hypoxylon sp. NC1633]
MAQGTEVSISCHCGAAQQKVALHPQEPLAPLDVDLCHCYACRHSTGLLCASYAPIRALPALDGLVAYPSASAHAAAAPRLRRYFCGTCGCHVFRWERRFDDDAGGEEVVGGLWAVATGVIVGRSGSDVELLQGDDGVEDASCPLLKCAGHVNTAGTRDGGLALFMDCVGESRETGGYGHSGTLATLSANSGEEAEDDDGDGDGDGGDSGKILQAHCLCKTIRFHITRPNASSQLLRSNFPDLTVPYATSPREVIANPHDEKWWLRPQGDPSPTKYLAGTCACRSCRLVSGFEIQTWAFVPRSNIFLLPSLPPPPFSSAPAPATVTPATRLLAPPDPIPLDFATLERRSASLRTYESSPGVRREFCPCCGATVFWHDRWRPGLVDVSVGLLDADEGARAGSWLEWWCGRVSFEEDAVDGRAGGVAAWARALVEGLADGMRRFEGGGEER